SGGYLLDEPPDMTPSFPRTGVSGHAGAVHNGIEGYKVRPPVAGGEIIPISPTRRCEMHTMSSAEYRGL
ncbi:hypothetical protein, partial [Mycobacterium tuberculosis]|uniref:hypothetical protein n=1 Tax=Mycobacterium tuberculosis TaxID=1773 RepID=UPI000931DFA3